MVKINNKDVLNVHSVKKVIFNNMLDLEHCSVVSWRQSLWFICRLVIVTDVSHNEVSDLTGTYLLQNLRYTHLNHTNTLHCQTGHWSVCLSHLPSLGALLGELGEVDRLLWVLLPVFLSTRLDEEGVRRRLPLRLVDVFTHHSGGLSGGRDENSSRRINTDRIDLLQLVFHIIY